MGRGSSLSCFHHLSLLQLLCQARATDLQGTHCPLALWAQRPTPEVPTQPRGLGPMRTELTHPASPSLKEPSRSTSVQPGSTERETGPPRGPGCVGQGQSKHEAPSVSPPGCPPALWAGRETCSEEGAGCPWRPLR